MLFLPIETFSFNYLPLLSFYLVVYWFLFHSPLLSVENEKPLVKIYKLEFLPR